ncbi:MAG: hypothetical protein ABSG16_19965 [Candidatus Acidiferrum sp.]
METHLAMLLLAIPCLTWISGTLSPAVVAFAQARAPQNGAAERIGGARPGTRSGLGAVHQSTNSFLRVR